MAQEKLEVQKLLSLAGDKRREGNYDEARNLVSKAQHLCQDDDFNLLGRVFHVKMQFEYDASKLEKALDLCRQSLGYYLKSGNLNKIAHSTRHISDLLRELGLFEESETSFRESIRIYGSDKNTFSGDLANALRGFALVLEALKKTNEAIEIWEETKSLYAQIKLQEGVDEASQRLIALARNS